MNGISYAVVAVLAVYSAALVYLGYRVGRWIQRRRSAHQGTPSRS